MRKFILAGTAAAALLPALASAQNRPAPARQPAAPAQPARAAAAPQSQIPQVAGLVVLIKGSLVALNQANQTGNYTVLYGLGSDGLRSSTNPQNLAQSFAAFRQRNVDLSPVIYLDPQLARQPAIEGGRLHLVGSFPTQPMRITFDIWFEPSQGQWKFVQLNAGLTPVQAQQQPPQPQRR
ncbi:MAG: hypothetical protein ACTHLU_08810 [Novosphingobium sp.]